MSHIFRIVLDSYLFPDYGHKTFKLYTPVENLIADKCNNANRLKPPKQSSNHYHKDRGEYPMLKFTTSNE